MEIDPTDAWSIIIFWNNINGDKTVAKQQEILSNTFLYYWYNFEAYLLNNNKIFFSSILFM